MSAALPRPVAEASGARARRITGVVQAADATEEQLMRLMTLTGDEHRLLARPEAGEAMWQETRI